MEAKSHGELTDRDSDTDSHPSLYWLMGASFDRNYGDSIGSDASTIAIGLNSRTLFGADWSTDPLTIFKVLNTTAAGSGDGALEVTGGGYFGTGIYSDAGVGITAGSFVKGAKSVDLCDGTNAIYTIGDIIGDFGDIKCVTGDYYCQSDQGQSVTDWFTGGIFKGSGVTEISGSDLQSTDRILVIR